MVGHRLVAAAPESTPQSCGLTVTETEGKVCTIQTSTGPFTPPTATALAWPGSGSAPPGTPRPLMSAPITALFPALRVPGKPASYTPELAMELLNGTGELPASKRALHIILAEHRRALHDLATSAHADQQLSATR